MFAPAFLVLSVNALLCAADVGGQLAQRGTSLAYGYSIWPPLLSSSDHHIVRAYGIESRQSGTCPSGSKVCSGGCLPTSYICCSDGTGGCAPTSYCVPGGCCPNGKTCSGIASGCDTGQKDCGNANCIPNSGTCCPDESGCLANSYCYNTGAGVYSCCNNGDSCGSAATIPALSSTSTRSIGLQTTSNSITRSLSALSTSTGGIIPDLSSEAASSSSSASNILSLATTSSVIATTSTRAASTSTTVATTTRSTTAPSVVTQTVTAASGGNSGASSSFSPWLLTVGSWQVFIEYFLMLYWAMYIC